MAANACLGLLLETTAAQQQKQHQLRPAAAPAEITSKATTLLATATATATAKSDVVVSSVSSASFSCSSSSRAPPTTSASRCSFLQRCFFCHGALADSRDIYIYRGERAFCSVECRCRHILAEDDADDDSASVGVVAADCSSQLRHQAVAGGFTF